MTTELRSLYSQYILEVTKIEQCIISYLPDLIADTTDTDLKQALTMHLKETEKQFKDMQAITGFVMSPEESLVEENTSFELMMLETADTLALLDQSHSRDAFIIAAATTVEHIEMTKYKTLIEWAKALEEDQDRELFEKIYREEKNAAETLERIAVGDFFNTGIIKEAANET